MRNGSRPQAGRRHLRAGNPRVRSRAVRYPGRKPKEGRSAGAQSGRKRPQEHGETVVFKPATFHGFRNDADRMAVELLGDAEKIRRPIVIQCHTPAPSGRQNRAFLRLFSMNWPVHTKTMVRFPSPAPLFSSAISQFFRALSYECHTKPPGSGPFPWVFSPRIELEDRHNAHNLKFARIYNSIVYSCDACWRQNRS